MFADFTSRQHAVVLFYFASLLRSSAASRQDVTRIILNRDAAILCEFANNQDVLAILVQKYTIVGVKMVEQFNAYENGSRQLLFCVSLFPISGCLDQ
jgi:hypothetical protein